MNHSRAHIRLNTTKEASEFVRILNSDGTTNKYIIEDFNGTHRADARSLLGVMYAMTDYNDEMYFVNETDDGVFPSCINSYRV